MQMSALCSAPVMASTRLGLRSPMLAIRPASADTAPSRTRLISCRAQTQDFAPQSETQMQGRTEPMVYKAIKVACLLPAVAALLWAEPAQAKKSRQPAAAAQIMEVQTAETHSAAEQLQAKWEQLMLQLQTGSLQQQVTAELKKPDVQKGLAAVAGLLLVAMIWKGSSGSSSTASSGSSSTTSSSSSGRDSSSSSTSSNAAALDAGGAAASLGAAASSNGTGAAAAAPRAVPATLAKQPVAASAAPSAAVSDAVSAQEILQVVKEAADKVSATAAATASEVSASTAATAAALERAQAVTDKAHSSLSRSTSPNVPEPPKLVKPSLTAAAAAPAVNKAAAAAAAAESIGNGNGAAAAAMGRRSPPPSPIPILPERGAATPALAVLGAGALLLDLMAPLGKLAVASVTGKVSRSSSPVSSARDSTSGGSNGTASSAPSSRSAAGAAPAAAAPATSAVQEVRKPATQSKLAKAVERATAEAAAAVPRTVPMELPPVTLKELEEALKAGQKV